MDLLTSGCIGVRGVLGDIGVLEVYGPIYLGKDIFTSIAVMIIIITIIFNLL